MASQTQPPGSSGTGTGSGLTAGSAALLKGWQKGDMANIRLIVRVTGDQTFRLSMLAAATDGGATYVVAKQVASAVVSVDGGTTGYVNNAELDIPVGAEWNVQVWAVGGTLGYVYDWRVYHAGTH